MYIPTLPRCRGCLATWPTGGRKHSWWVNEWVNDIESTPGKHARFQADWPSSSNFLTPLACIRACMLGNMIMIRFIAAWLWTEIEKSQSGLKDPEPIFLKKRDGLTTEKMGRSGGYDGVTALVSWPIWGRVASLPRWFPSFWTSDCEAYGEGDPKNPLSTKYPWYIQTWNDGVSIRKLETRTISPMTMDKAARYSDVASEGAGGKKGVSDLWVEPIQMKWRTIMKENRWISPLGSKSTSSAPPIKIGLNQKYPGFFFFFFYFWNPQAMPSCASIPALPESLYL